MLLWEIDSDIWWLEEQCDNWSGHTGPWEESGDSSEGDM